jgi:hypothetical protein
MTIPPFPFRDTMDEISGARLPANHKEMGEGDDTCAISGARLRLKPQKTVTIRSNPVDPVAEAARIDRKQEAEFTQHVIDVMKARYLAEFDAEPVAEVKPAPIEPEHHFADLMLADETIDDAKARLSQRLRELRHYLIAPEIKVNEDGSVGLTAGEQAELQDLERRQTLGRWLEA